MELRMKKWKRNALQCVAVAAALCGGVDFETLNEWQITTNAALANVDAETAKTGDVASNEAAKKTNRSLVGDFISPPDSARPGVYWFFLDANLSKEGMKADLEAMKRAGIGRAIAMEANQGGPKGSVAYMTPEWLDCWRFAGAEAKRLGIDLTLASGPGWCGAGGPWIRPENSMQHLRSSETKVVGPTRFEGNLPKPTPRDPYFGRGSLGPCEEDWREFYRDVAVLAFPTPKGNWRLPDWEEKALFFRPPYSSLPGVKPFLPPTPETPDAADSIVDASQIRDISQFMDANGRLTWDVPEGEWTILRLGRRLTGQTTRPAPDAGLGLESDKFETTGIDAHFAAFNAKMLDVAEFTTLHHDSWEMSSQNWSENFREHFTKRRGYDPLPWTPAMFGIPVESVEKTERFLWDLRRTARELVYENNVLRMKELGAARGLDFSTEAYDLNPAGDLYLFRAANVPMGEFWSRGYGFDADFSVFEAVSSGHTTGAQVVGAESFTTSGDKWRQHPGAAKRQGDWAFCAGINRLVFHRMCAQPNSDAPGLSLGGHGMHWDRTQTWFPMADGYCDYISRVQAVLQRGVPSADVLFLDREDAPTVFVPPTSAFLGGEFKDKRGYNFDGCAPQVLLDLAVAKDGKIVFPGGATYSVLVLPQTETMTPELAKKLRELADAGVPIVGTRPKRSPGLEKFPNDDAALNAELDALWSGKNPPIAPPGTGTPRRAPLLDARWIWANADFGRAAPGEKSEFIKTFEVPENVALNDASISVAADNVYELYVNGKRLGSGSNFRAPDVYALADVLKSGENVLRIVVVNEGERPNPAGLLAALDFGDSASNLAPILTDATWTTNASNGESGAVAAVELGGYGMSPWGLAPPKSGDATYPSFTFVAQLLKERGLAPDFESTGDVRWVRRIDGDADVYFVGNRLGVAQTADCVFRVSGKKAQLWDPTTGRRYRVDTASEENGRTTIPLSFAPSQSWLVVFRPDFNADASNAELSEKAAENNVGNDGAPQDLTPTSRLFAADAKFKYFDVLNEGWSVAFDQNAASGRDFPEGRRRVERFETLQDWSKNADPIIRYYSGVGVYETTFDLPLDAASQEKTCDGFFLELGKVGAMARVELNDVDLGVVWTDPWRVEIPSDLIRAKDNRLTISVANLWCNRLIGDASLPVEKRFTRTSNPQWGPGDGQLLPSGLLGPVRLGRRVD